MPGELVRVLTEDRLWLDGVFQSPSASAGTSAPVDAFLLVHGTGSNFYAPGVLETFAGQAAAQGIAAVRINTRGHDGISSIPGEQRSIRGGATYEHVADCPSDLHAWLDFLAQRGYSRVALVGHSMGGVKSAYTLAHRWHPVVRALVLISSPRFNHAAYQGHPSAGPFREAFARASQAVDQGRPDELIPLSQPMPFLATAAGILDKYGPEDTYDWNRLLPLVACPALYILGTESPRQSIGFDGVPETLAALTGQYPHLRHSLVEGANTNYSGGQQIPFERAWAWLQTLP